MKKTFTDLRTLLASLMMLAAMGAWADEVVLSPTGGVTTVNPESTEVAYIEGATSWVINQGGISGDNFGKYPGPYCLVKFDASEVPGTITGAKLTFDYEASAYNTSYNIYQLGAADWDATTATFATLSDDSKKATQIASGTWSTKNVTGSIVYDNLLNYVSKSLMGFSICCNTARQQTISNIKLTITYTTESAYSVTFTEANGVNSTVKIGDLDATAGAKLTDGTYSFVASATGYYDYNGSFTVAGADIDVPFALTPKGIYNYTVRGLDKDNNDLGVVSTGSDYENSNITYHYPRFALSGETLYVKNKKSDNPWFGISDMLSSDGQEFNVTYSDGIVENVVFYKEAEDIEGMLPTTTSNADIRCSNGTGAYTPEGEDITVTELQPGKYQIFTSVWGNAGTTFNIVCGDVTLTCETKGYIQDYNSGEIVLTSATPVVIQAAGNANRCLDFIYIVRVPESYDYTVTAVDVDFNALGVIGQGSAYAGNTVTVPFPRFIMDGTSLKETAAIEKQYNLTFTLDENPAEKYITYDQSTIDDVVFFSEAEALEGMTAVTTGNANIRCSMGTGAFAADADVYVTTLQPGNYIINTAVWGNAGTTLNIVCGDVTLACETTGSLTVRATESFTLTAATDVYIQQGGAGGSSPKCFDYIYIQQVPESYAYTVDAVNSDFDQIGTIATGTTYAGNDVTVAYPKYMLDGTTLRAAAALSGDGKEYTVTFNVSEDPTNYEIEYKAEAIEDVVFYAEAEAVAGMTQVTSGNANIRCSMAAGAYAADADVYVTTLQPGNYVIGTAVWGGKDTALDIVCGDFTFTTITTGSLTTNVSQAFTLTAATDVYFKVGGQGGSSPKCFDYIYIQQVPEIYQYALYAQDANGNTLKTIAEGTDFAGKEITIAYPRFYLDGATLKEAAATNKEYRKVLTLEAPSTDEFITYNDIADDVVFYSEAEDIAGMTRTTSGGADIRCSMAAGAYAEADAFVTTLQAGNYIIYAATRGQSEGSPIVIDCGGNTLECAINGNLLAFQSEVFTLTGATDVVIKAGGDKNHSLDYIYIQQLPANITATIGAEGWATLYTDYAISFAGTGVAAYTATTDGTTVTLTEVQDVPAGTGVVLKGEAGNYEFNVIGSSAADKGDLKGSTTENLDAATADVSYNYYMLVKNASGEAQFKLLTSGVITAGKAYLQVANGGARDLNVVFNGTTGINAIMAAEAAEGAYNLAGQRVAAPQKGLYIVNGKKVMVK